MSELVELRVRRGQQKAAVTRIKKFVDKLDVEAITQKLYFELKARLEKLYKINEEFENIQDKIELLQETTGQQEEEDYRNEFEETYFSVSATLENIMHAYSDSRSNSSNGNNNSGSDKKRVKLPTIQLPSFDGEYENWITFRDMFTSLIHNERSLSKTDKLHYLKASLKGKASGLLDAYQISEGNYDAAFNTLLQRYDNKQLLIHHHLKLMFESPVVYKESLPELRKLVDDIKSNVTILQNIGIDTRSWDTWLLYLISTKLDNVTKREWEEHISPKDIPLLTDFYEFMNQRFQFLVKFKNDIENSEKKSSNKHIKQPNLKSSSTKTFLTSNSSKLCPHCKEEHLIFYCRKFLDLPVRSRHQVVKHLKLCINCMKSNHVAKVCVAGGCKKCGMKHNTLLHFDPKGTQSSSIQSKTIKSQEALVSEVPIISASLLNNNEVLLSTALINVVTKDKKIHKARVLLDSGSQSNFITREFFNKLNISSTKIKQPVTGICQQKCLLSDAVDLEVRSRINNFSFQANCLVIDTITDKLPQSRINVQALKIPENIILADPDFSIPGKIDMLLGAATFWNLICVGQLKLNGKQPILQKTRLGWIISGEIPHKQDTKICNFLSLDEHLEKFWSLEDIKFNSVQNHETEFEKYFKNTLKINDKGHFEVGLPIKKNVVHLGDSFNQAHTRFLQLEKRLSRSENMRRHYEDFMSEYEQLGHMSLVPDNDKSEGNSVYYLPHHGVFKETSITTKLRVVFDGSAKTDTGIALNDVLMSGSVLQDDLFSILLRFRKHSIVIASDIEKMYRQVYITPQHRDFQRILWRKSREEPIKKYRLNTVTYGTTSGSFLAIRCLHEVANRIENTFPDISKIIKQDFYVDDLLTGGETVEETLRLQTLLTSKLQDFGFPLRKWNSNHPLVVETILKQSNSELKHVVIEDSLTKTLGLYWDAKKDYLHYSISNRQKTSPTKRSILASIAQIFDPLGLIGPVTVLLKILMQELWRSNVQWDESLPQEMHTKWKQYQINWKYINEIAVPRQIIFSRAVNIQLHGFCDASQAAYGACIYVMSEDDFGKRTVGLLCSKSKVAPVKGVTLPRLELCAALLLSRLTAKVINSLKMNFNKKYLWTDSQITLAWIAKEPNHWKSFIANRVAEIQELTENCLWRHVSGKENPADIISRGMSAEELLHSDRWWNGPQWLTLAETEWPILNTDMNIQDIPERKRISLTLVTTQKFELFEKYSTFRKLQHIVCYIQRFINNCKKNNIKRSGVLQAEELQEALLLIIKKVQNEEYSEELIQLRKGKMVSKKSKLLSLNPIIDDQGILRVGGRIEQSNLNFEEKHQIIIPGTHRIAELLIKEEHHKQLHSGAQTILYSLRQKFWIIGGLNTIKKILRKCLTCFRTKPIFYKHQMGQLPKDRIFPSSPFQNCGVDYAGPINIKSSTLKNSKILKAYISIFICFSTKAIHIELVPDLTTETFLKALKRFISRRGKPQNIYSDNGRNFVGAKNEIKRVEKSLKISKFIAEENIRWHFIPPRSPHFGGLWESAVKSVKTHLKRVIGETILTFEELYTILVQIEACLNSRPISPISDDPNDLSPLTPAHFLLTKPIACLPEENILSLPQNRLNRYQHLMYMFQRFWARWSKEYLNNLQQRTKWKTNIAKPPKEGDMVLISDESTPPMQWILGRITKLHPGADGIVRVAELKTSSGITTRAIRKLCPLPQE